MALALAQLPVRRDGEMSSSLSAEPRSLLPYPELQRQMVQLASIVSRLVLVGKTNGAIRQWTHWRSVLNSRRLVFMARKQMTQLTPQRLRGVSQA